MVKIPSGGEVYQIKQGAYSILKTRNNPIKLQSNNCKQITQSEWDVC